MKEKGKYIINFLKAMNLVHHTVCLMSFKNPDWYKKKNLGFHSNYGY